MAHPEDDPTDDWDPDKEKRRDPGAMMEKYMKILEEKILPGMERDNVRSAFGSIATIPSHSQITIRRIRNGFLMTYYEAQEQLAPPGVGIRVFHPKEVEVFLRNHEEGTEHLKAALLNAELLSKSAEAVHEAYARQARLLAPVSPAPPVNPDEETRKIDRPPDPA